MSQKQEVPAYLAEKCEEFTKQWLASLNCEAIPYLQSGEIDDEWRIAVWHAPLGDQQEKTLLSKHIQPTVEGHTLYLLASACFDAEARGKEIGKNETLLNLFRQQCTAAGIGNSLRNITIERDISGELRKTSLAKK